MSKLFHGEVGSDASRYSKRNLVTWTGSVAVALSVIVWRKCAPPSGIDA